MKKVAIGFASSALVISIVALSLRVAFLVDQALKIPHEALASVPFQNEVGSIAASLAAGNGFCCLFRQPTGPTAWLAPVYPILIAGIFRLFGSFSVHSFYAAALLNTIFSALVCIPLYSMGKRVGGVFVGVCAAWVWAFFPSGILMPFEWIWDTSLSALLTATLLWATLELADSWSRRTAALYGLLWGFALLTNPVLGVLFPFLLGWSVYRQGPRRMLSLVHALLALFLAVACCLPWTIRNAEQFHRLIPLRSNFAFELWLGNNELFDEHSRQINRISRFEQVRRYAQLGESVFLDEKWAQAKDFLRAHPALAVKLTGRRMIATWLGTETPWQDLQRADSFLVRFLFVWNAITLLGMAVGIGRLFAERNPLLFPIASIPVVFPAIYYVTHTSLRYRHPCDPILALLLAVALLGGTVSGGTHKAS